MSRYHVYKHPDGRLASISDGFTFFGAFFGGFWLFRHSLWIHGTIALVIGFGVYAVFPSPEGYLFGVPYGHRFGLADIINLAGMAVIGILGNSWRMDSMAHRGFDYVFDTDASTADGAVASYLRSQNTQEGRVEPRIFNL